MRLDQLNMKEDLVADFLAAPFHHVIHIQFPGKVLQVGMEVPEPVGPQITSSGI